jgi:ATP-dependent DNA helicase RecQ
VVVARLNKTDTDTAKLQLHQLHKAGVIEYNPQKDSPQILLLRERVKAEELIIDVTAFKIRKEKFINRSKMMVQYAHETVFCRSRLMGAYFGDKELRNCGVCDNCLSQKALVVNREDFNKISGIISSALATQPLPAKDLILQLGSIKKEKAWKVIDQMQAEDKIEMDASGWIRLK